MNIIKPKFDSRKYYGGQLNNNIKYILVHDKSLTVSYVSVSVNVGNYSDPEQYNGLAHFLEHMLFMGSKKYPDVDYYFTKHAAIYFRSLRGQHYVMAKKSI